MIDNNTNNNEKSIRDFSYIIYRENLWKFISIGIIFLIVELGLVISLPSIWGDYVNTLRIYIIGFSIFSIPLMIYVYIKYEKLYRFAPMIVHFTMLVILFWAAEVSIYYQLITNHIMVYIAAVLVFGNITLIKLKTKLIILAIPQVWFMLNIGEYIVDQAVLISHYVNSNLIFIISIALSAYIFKLREDNYTYITTIEDQNKKLTDLTLVDSMTGLYNHNSIYNLLEKEIDYSKRYGTSLSIIMYDIDFFKSINDTYGHVYGDEVLIKFATKLKNNTRTTDHIGRYGGEEFLVILPNTTLTDAKIKANMFRKTIEESVFKESLKLTISGGVTQWSDETAEHLVEYTDQLMYIAKKNGRNKIESNLKSK